MNAHELANLFDAYIAVQSKIDQAHRKLATFIARQDVPSLQTQYTSIGAYLCDQERITAYQSELSQLQADKDQYNNTHLNLAHQINAQLAKHVWIKHGDVGIGVSTNKHGTSWKIVVSPWAQEMPSLVRSD